MGWGDELLVTGQVREAQSRDPRRVRIAYERARWHEAWDHNPRIARPEDTGDFQTLVPRHNGLRPYMAGKSPSRWIWQRWVAPVGELYLTEAERTFGARHGGRILIEPHIKPGASPNKLWGWTRWQQLADALVKRYGPCVAQLGAPGTVRLAGVEFIETRGMRLACAVLANARAAVLPEGGLHHAAAALGVPAVVIRGGFISPRVTGYSGQRDLYVEDPGYPLGCGLRIPCPHCAEAMQRITPEQVLAELENALEKLPRPVAA